MSARPDVSPADSVADPPPLADALRQRAAAATGFMPEAEGLALYAAGWRAARAVPEAPLLEIGSYCGKSAIYLGAAARARGTVLFSIDHHSGSEEHQPGWEYHDPALVDPDSGRFDTLLRFRRTVAEAGLEDTVIGIVGGSAAVAAHWRTPVALAFIDGSHTEAAATADYEAWAPLVAPGGLLAIHDVYPGSPTDG